MTTSSVRPNVRCSYCGGDSCDHPSRLARVEFVEWLLEQTGPVLHVFARRQRGLVVYDCPFCGKQHRHGDAFGSRATHCLVRVPMTVVLHPEEDGS